MVQVGYNTGYRLDTLQYLIQVEYITKQDTVWIHYKTGYRLDTLQYLIQVGYITIKDTGWIHYNTWYRLDTLHYRTQVGYITILDAGWIHYKTGYNVYYNLEINCWKMKPYLKKIATFVKEASFFLCNVKNNFLVCK